MCDMSLPAPWSLTKQHEEEEQPTGDCEPDLIANKLQSMGPYLENLSHDITSHIFSYLPLASIHSIFLTSKSLQAAANANELWKLKYSARWNIMPDLPWPDTAIAKRETFWKCCFKNAFCHPHDLWLTHWNCVLPHDGESDGRTCLPDTFNHEILNARTFCSSESNSESLSKLCPTCRYHPLLSSNLENIQKDATEREISFQKLKQSKDQLQESFQDHDPVFQTRQRTWEAKAYTNESVRRSTLYSVAKYSRRMHALESMYDDNQIKEYLSSNPSIDSNTKSLKIHYRHKRKCIQDAFSNASTFQRKICTEQYRASGIHFFTDALFFKTSEKEQGFPHDHEQTFDYNNKHSLYDDVYGNSKTDEEGIEFPLPVQISQHSWHICRLQNPDFTRPITFKTWIQRPDCFSVYPSEGFIQPGETTYIYFSIKPKGSIITACMEEIDIKREECHEFFQKKSSEEGNLPLVPFLIRYMFAPILPMGINGTLGEQIKQSKKVQLLNELWDSFSIQKQHAQSLYVSAHVHSNYSLEQFQNETLIPFEICSSRVHGKECADKKWNEPSPMVLVAPNLQQYDDRSISNDIKCSTPMQIFDFLQNLTAGEHRSSEGDSSQPCTVCKMNWIIRSEEFGRRFVTRKLICSYSEKLRKMKLIRIWQCIRSLESYFEYDMEDEGLSLNIELLNKDIEDSFQSSESRSLNQLEQHEKNISDLLQQLNRIFKLLYHMHETLLEMIAYPNLKMEEKNMLKEYECHINDMCICIQDEIQKSKSLIQLKDLTKSILNPGTISDSSKVNATEPYRNNLQGNPWRMSGVYESIKSTDSSTEYLHDKPLKLSNYPYFKEEPERFQRFRRFANSTGMYSFGLEEDPNQIQNLHSIKNRVDSDLCSSYHSDIFKNNLKYAFNSSIAMIHDPKSLMVQGVYDRVKSAGVVRAPFSPHFIFWPNDNVAEVTTQGMAFNDMNKEDITSGGEEKMLKPRQRLNISWNDPDPDGYAIMNKKSTSSNNKGFATCSMERYLMNVPPPGVGRYLLSTRKNPSAPLWKFSIEVDGDESKNIRLFDSTQPNGENSFAHATNPLPPAPDLDAQNNNGRNRALNIVWLICTSLGWHDSCSEGAPIVNRKLLIAAQWWSNSFMFVPMICTLVARWLLWVTPLPMAYHLDGIPFSANKKMR